VFRDNIPIGHPAKLKFRIALGVGDVGTHTAPDDCPAAYDKGQYTYQGRTQADFREDKLLKEGIVKDAAYTGAQTLTVSFHFRMPV
jgi:hypothetical protein